MSQTDALKKYLDAGMAFTHLTRAKAEQVVKDLVAAGELQRNQAKDAIDDLLDRSRKNGETLTEQVRKEVDVQLSSLGLARKADVEKLEAELAQLKGSGAKPSESGTRSGSDKDEKDDPAPKKKPAPAKKAPPKPQAEDTSEDKDKAAGQGSSGGAEEHGGAAGRGEAMPATQASKPGKTAASKGSKRAEADSTPIGGDLPAKKAGGTSAKAAPAKKGGEGDKAPAEMAPAAGKTPTSGELPAKKAAKKTAKKQG